MGIIKPNTAEASIEVSEPKFRRVWSITKQRGSASSIVVPALLSTTVTATATSVDSIRPWMRNTTSAILNNASGLISAAFNQVWAQWDAEFETIVTVQGGATGQRSTIGFFSANPDITDWINTNPAISFIGFQVDNPTPLAVTNLTYNWVSITSDGTTTTRSPSSLAKPTTFSTLTGPVTHKLRARVYYGSRVEFYINNILVATHTTSIPTATLGYGIRITTTTAATNYIEWSSFYVKFNG